MTYTDDLLDDVIRKRIEELEKTTPGSQEQSRIVSDLVSLLNARLNRKKDEDARRSKDHDDYVAFQREEANRKREAEMDEHKRKSEKIERIIRIVLELIAIGAPLAVYAFFLKKGFKFEETGTYTSNTFRNLLNKLGGRRK